MITSGTHPLNKNPGIPRGASCWASKTRQLIWDKGDIFAYVATLIRPATMFRTETARHV